MFARPRPKKSLLPPPVKKRKTTSAVQEITFDNEARQEYLTGFHKRKLQRVKYAQEQAAKQARQERLETRKQIREERRRDIEQHVETVNRLLRDSGAVVDPVESPTDQQDDSQDDEWAGFPDKPDIDIVDHEEEYIDEDRFTTVTVESVSVSREGLSKAPRLGDETVDDGQGDDNGDAAPTEDVEENKDSKPARSKKRKFRYESKFERKLTQGRQRAKSKSKRSR